MDEQEPQSYSEYTKIDPLIVGMAIMITDQNTEKIAVVNGGVVPQVGKYGTRYYVLMFDGEDAGVIMTLESFMDSFRFVDGEALDHFKQITWSY